ncbi:MULTISPECIES: ACR3 family arsenite efflux transporter [unclassified Flavobacterium]|uniref:ACR3 family arsenite efflux transporter n=1 Tax=unclassified Flavobacterium TaxID=196869 RepID=UPI00086CB828|nr:MULTISPECIES: ACR3 family arsenite efflux transporter [unclassified Flavobacterium]MBN9286170.1 ACR3 family arsenite efflux transporter [Flavobacterium sp.]ODS85077.1 MAG: arsenical-resistance protein [Chryseobacterium sp. SCN 40-13]OJV73892.1 MAG: arsenical-resistance protein [Flavobacterium sp. 40-81]
MQTKLRFLDRYLTLWIFLAMLFGILLGNIFPGITTLIDSLSWGTTNIPLAIGLLLMLYPPLTKVEYGLLPKAIKNKTVLSVSLILNWIVGPLLMFTLAVILLRDEPAYMTGLILIGLARCIAMVIVWNDLAKGNREYAALLIALNSIFQIFSYSFYVWLFLNVLPEKLGIGSFNIAVPMRDVTESVLLYLGLPFVLGFLSRYTCIKMKGKHWFQTRFLPFISPFTLYALLFTIVLMFSLKGEAFLALPKDVIKVSIPLLLYFVLMFLISFFTGKAFGIPYDKNAAVAFTATGNNFELAIAVAIGVFGIHSPQAFAGVIGPLIEVPVLILLVRTSLYLKKQFYDPKKSTHSLHR